MRLAKVITATLAIGLFAVAIYPTFWPYPWSGPRTTIITVPPGAKPRHTAEEAIRAASALVSGRPSSVRFEPSRGVWRVIYSGRRKGRPSGSIIIVRDADLRAERLILA